MARFPAPVVAPAPAQGAGTWTGLPAHEVFSLATHGAGAVLAAVGTVALLLRDPSPLARAAHLVYGLTLVLLFASSALHHAITPRPGAGEAFRRLDHAAIYLSIAGTYTPPCLLHLPPQWGLPLLAAVWAFALVGIGLKVALPITPPWLTVVPYVAMGWLAVVAAKPILAILPPLDLAILLAGGATFTVGGVVYALERPNPLPRYVGAHGVWHILVLVGSACCYLLIWRYAG